MEEAEQRKNKEQEMRERGLERKSDEERLQ